MESFLIIYRYHVCRRINQFEWLSKIMGSSGLMERCETLIVVLSRSMCSLRNPIIFLWRGRVTVALLIWAWKTQDGDDAPRGDSWPADVRLTAGSCHSLPWINPLPSIQSTFIALLDLEEHGNGFESIRSNPYESLKDRMFLQGDEFDFHRLKSWMVQTDEGD